MKRLFSRTIHCLSNAILVQEYFSPTSKLKKLSQDFPIAKVISLKYEVLSCGCDNVKRCHSISRLQKIIGRVLLVHCKFQYELHVSHFFIFLSQAGIETLEGLIRTLETPVLT